MSRTLTLILMLPSLAAMLNIGSVNANAAATEPYGLDAMTQFDRLPYLKLDTLGGGQSSYDRSGGNADFSNFLYATNGEQVLLDLTGPGTVYRIWFTGFNQSTDYVKVYFDGESTPRINLPLQDLFSGTQAPFLAPLVGNDTVSSGGFYCYLPLPFSKSIRIVSNATAGSFYYNIGYDLYSRDASVTTWTGNEDSSAARTIWSNAGNDPKSDSGNVIVSDTFNLAASATQTLLDVSGPRSISSIKLHVPGLAPSPSPPAITDDGRADKGYSQFQMTLDPNNNGATLVRRLDYGIADQIADVYVNGTLVGQWSDPGSDGTYHWRNSSFNIPSTFTAGKSAITFKVVFVSSANDWNEFHYWTYSQSGTTSNLTDTLDVGDSVSESNHDYTISNRTWSGTRTFQYPSPPVAANLADMLTNLWLKISFDDETNSSVDAPIGSFFAMGQFAPYATRGLPVGMDSNNDLYVYFPMPFARRAVVQLISRRSVSTTNIYSEIKYQPFTNSFANVGCFKAQFNREIPTTNGSDIVMLDAEGAGHLVGVVMSMMGPTSRAYLEGDERIYVDDSQTPAFQGTGTEDFFNGGWYFDHGLFTLPTHGNTAHLADVNYDYTSAYRLFMADAIPFRKHIRAGIEHGAVDDVSENVWTLAYYYYQPAARMVLTDQLDVGNNSSETAHHYVINNQTWSGTRTHSYEGDFDNVNITDDGRANKGYSQFTMALQPANAGAILRRRFDQSIASQKANVYVDGSLVGTWYYAGSNASHSWRDDDFMIPASYTSGKNSIEIKVQFLSSNLDWNEFNYRLYTLKPPATANTVTPRFTGFNWMETPETPAFALRLTGGANASYDIWASTNLRDWAWLGRADETRPGLYDFTDATAIHWPQRFYRAGGP